ERPFRLKTESACCVGELHGADSQIGQQAACARCRDPLPNFRIRLVDQRDCRCLAAKFGCEFPEALARQLQRLGILIEANQMTLWAKAPCEFVGVAAKPEG